MRLRFMKSKLLRVEDEEEKAGWSENVRDLNFEGEDVGVVVGCGTEYIFLMMSDVPLSVGL